MAPDIAAALILATGGVLLAVCGLLTVRQLRTPALDRSRLDALERSQKSESERVDRLIGEAHKAAIDARRMAASRRGKREREEVDDTAEPRGPEPRQTRTPVFRPGCDAYGHPVWIPTPAPDNRDSVSSARETLTRRGFTVGADGALEATA